MNTKSSKSSPAGWLKLLLLMHADKPLLSPTLPPMLLIAPSFHSTQLLFGSDPRDSHTRFGWPSTNYNHTSCVIKYFVALAPAFLRLCNHRLVFCSHGLVTLQSRLSLAVLFQTNFLAKFTPKTRRSQMIDFLLTSFAKKTKHITLRSSQTVNHEPMSPKL